LKDKDERDAHSMLPLDAILSSPASAETNQNKSSSPTRNPSAEKSTVKVENGMVASSSEKYKASAVNGLPQHRDDSDSEKLNDAMGAGEKDRHHSGLLSKQKTHC
jgi:centromere protein C